MARTVFLSRGDWVFRWALGSDFVAVFACGNETETVPFDMYEVPADINRSQATESTLDALADRWLRAHSPILDARSADGAARNASAGMVRDG